MQFFLPSQKRDRREGGQAPSIIFGISFLYANNWFNWHIGKSWTWKTTIKIYNGTYIIARIYIRLPTTLNFHYSSVVDLAKLPRKGKLPNFHYSQSPNDSFFHDYPQKIYCQLYFETFDNIINCIKDHFNQTD